MATLNRGYTFVAHQLGRAGHVEGEFDNFRSNINTRVCADGTLHFTGAAPLTLEYDDPCLELIDTQTTGETWRIKGSVDTTAWLDFDCYDTGTSAWVNVVRLPVGVDNARAQFLADCQLRNAIVRDATPYVTWEGTEASAEYYKMEEDTGVLSVLFWDDPSWDILMRFITDTRIDMYVPLWVDDIYERNAAADITLHNDVVASGAVTVTDALTLNGTPPIATNKCVKCNNLNMKKVCTLTFSHTEIHAGDQHSTNNMYVYKAVTGATGGGLIRFEPLIYSATLEAGAGHLGVEAVMVYDPNTTWKVCIIIHDYAGDHINNEVVIDVYEWQENPADHT